MSDEDFVTGEGRIQLPNSDDVEELLEILMKIAKSEGREFLACLLGWLSWKPATSLLRRHISRISGTNLDFADWSSLAGWLGASRAMLYLRVSNNPTMSRPS